MAKKGVKRFKESWIMNDATFNKWLRQLTSISLSVFEWKNIPKTIDARFLEATLFYEGYCLFFRDEDLDLVEGERGSYLVQQCTISGQIDYYRIPKLRYAYSANGYQAKRDDTNSVLIYNNNIHNNTLPDIELYAYRLYEIDRAIDVNIRGQKTPIMILCDDKQRLVMQNLYKQYDGNEPFIFGNKSLDLTGVQVLNTGSPYLVDKLQAQKMAVLNEFYDFMGISNVQAEKKERLVTDEVTRSMGGAVMQRYGRLTERQRAAGLINNMFGLNVSVDYRENIEELKTQVDTNNNGVVEEEELEDV